MIIQDLTIIGGEMMKYLLSLMLLIATIGVCIGDIECPPRKCILYYLCARRVEHCWRRMLWDNCIRFY
jgi:hypothetical protein